MLRLRTQDRSTVRVNSYYSKAYSSNCSSAAAWGSPVYTNFSTKDGSFVSMWDTVVPGFYKRRLAGEVFFNYMVRDEAVITPGSGSGVGRVRSNTQACSAPWIYYPEYEWGFANGGTSGRVRSGFNFSFTSSGALSFPTSYLDYQDLQRAISEASTSCLSARGRTDANWFETLAEANKALGMFGSALQNAAQFFGKNRSIVQRAKAAGNAYLLYRYGFSPILKDVVATRKALQREWDRVRVTTRKYALANSSKTVQTTSNLWGVWTISQTFAFNESVNVKALSLDDWVVSGLEELGFNERDFLTLPWELIPYSFVVDWFVNIGDFIGAMAPSSRLRQLCSGIVLDRAWTCTFTHTEGQLSYAGHTEVVRPPSGECVYTFTRKERIPGLPPPSIAIKRSFGFENLKRCGDAAALIVQRLR